MLLANNIEYYYKNNLLVERFHTQREKKIKTFNIHWLFLLDTDIFDGICTSLYMWYFNFIFDFVWVQLRIGLFSFFLN